MLTEKEMVSEIERLKEDKGAIILAHNYQLPEIQDIANILGDSLDLSRKASTTKNKTIVFCGVKFMAESAKLLSPDKTVLIPRIDAGCAMASMVNKADLIKFKEKHPKSQVVAYVNTTAETKAESDICCTSANAVKIVQGLDTNEIIFIPDKNLGSYVSKFTDKKIHLWPGFCYFHDQFSIADVERVLNYFNIYQESITKTEDRLCTGLNVVLVGRHHIRLTPLTSQRTDPVPMHHKDAWLRTLYYPDTGCRAREKRTEN